MKAMKEKTKNNLIIVVPVMSVLILGIIIISFYGPDVDNSDLYSNPGSIFETNRTIVVNQSFLDNQSVILMGRNGTILFEGKLNNKTMWNTSLTLNMTFRDFVNMITPYNFDYDMYGIIEQAAYQLSKDS